MLRTEKQQPFLGKRVHGPIIAAAGAPLLLTALLTSDLTPCGRAFYSLLQAGEYLAVPLLAAGLGLILVGHLLDVLLWKDAARWLAQIYALITGAVLFVGMMLHSSGAPSIPVCVGIFLSIGTVVLLRHTLLFCTPISKFNQACSLVFLVLGILNVLLWVLYVCVPSWHHAGSNWGYDELPGLTVFILHDSPLLMALGCYLISVFTMFRIKLHQATGTEEDDDIYVAGEIRLVVAVSVVVILTAWVAATLAMHDIGLSMTVIRLSVAAGLAIVVYLMYVIGIERLQRTISRNSAAQAMMPFFQSDWMKGGCLLVFWPVVLAYFAMEVVHQLLRGPLQRSGLAAVPEDDIGKDADLALLDAWITPAAARRWRQLCSWSWTLVLRNSIWLGVLYTLLMVGVGKVLALFLSWFNGVIAAWPLYWILLALFGVGVSLFMLPPVPGMPIYLLSGVLIVHRCEDDGHTFLFGCSLAISFGFVMKMMAITLQQKCIGECFSQSVRVKRTIAVHTPFMKAVKYILSQKGWTVGKVAVLCGGPDWPTSVLTGILQLEVLQMLLGSVPVILLIVPFTLSGAYSMRASAAEDTAQKDAYECINKVMLLLSALVSLSSAMLACYHVNDVLERFKTEIESGNWQSDPQDKEVLEMVDADEEYTRMGEWKTEWSRLPVWLRVTLFVGSAFSSACTHIVAEPFTHPFVEFSLTAHISDLPGGTPLGMILPTGWVAVIFFCCSLLCLGAFEVWKSCVACTHEPDEVTPLVARA
jgi:hypothetical protein